MNALPLLTERGEERNSIALSRKVLFKSPAPTAFTPWRWRSWKLWNWFFTLLWNSYHIVYWQPCYLISTASAFLAETSNLKSFHICICWMWCIFLNYLKGLNLPMLQDYGIHIHKWNWPIIVGCFFFFCINLVSSSRIEIYMPWLRCAKEYNVHCCCSVAELCQTLCDPSYFSQLILS